LIALMAVVSCGGDDDDEEFDEEDEPVAASPTQAPTIPASSPAQPTPSVSAPSPAPTAPSAASTGSPAQPSTFATASGDLPRLTTQVDLLFTDLNTGQLIFEVEAESQFGESPSGSIVPLEGSPVLEDMIRANLDWLSERGYTEFEVYGVEGDGAVYFDSQLLASLRHEGFDYNSQYDGPPEDDELKIDEEEARGRYYWTGNLLPFVMEEAHSRGMKVAVLIESLAHIINRAGESGIGAGGLSISGNLPPLTVEQVLTFVDEVLATGADAISSEAFSIDYDTAIANHLASKGVPYMRTGADVGTVWQGYYYSFYPDQKETRDVYTYVHSDTAVFGSTNGTTFARAGALSPEPETSVVVGAYNPIPCDTSLSLADVYSETRSLPIDENQPTLDDGTVVENCATGPWLNLLTIAALRQGVDRILLTADMEASIAASSRPDITTEILQRIAAHPRPDDARPVANIILDRFRIQGDGGFSADEYFEHVSLSIVGNVDDALEAAGYSTVLTYDRPWDGGDVALSYVLTPGGNEDTEDEVGMGPPYWNNGQDLSAELSTLLDSASHPGPVFIHPIVGLPDFGTWQSVRQQFGLPPRFAFANPALSSFEEYHTSLLTSFAVTSEGENEDASKDQSIFPATGQVLGRSVSLAPFSDFYRLGEIANLAGPDDVAADRIFASGPMHVPTSGGGREERTAPYLVIDGQGNYLWLLNQLHHEAFTFITGQAIAQATGQPAVLVEPTKAHVWSGLQTFALAYDNTTVNLQLPYEAGQAIDITIYDVRSQLISEQRGVPYSGSVQATLNKHSLLVVEPAR
ncbi:MAG: hypothetical protein QF368_05500, partial [SAR202 cluster bacterium]|nr:hypothetical protein [SAR202 cluster bacterium]